MRQRYYISYDKSDRNPRLVPVGFTLNRETGELVEKSTQRKTAKKVHSEKPLIFPGFHAVRYNNQTYTFRVERLRGGCLYGRWVISYLRGSHEIDKQHTFTMFGFVDYVEGFAPWKSFDDAGFCDVILVAKMLCSGVYSQCASQLEYYTSTHRCVSCGRVLSGSVGHSETHMHELCEKSYELLLS